MSTSKLAITLEEVTAIVKDELNLALAENIDHTGIRDVVTMSSKLMDAVEAFKKAAPPPAVFNGVANYLDGLMHILEDVVNNPASYVTKQPTRKIISFKPAASKKD